MVKETSRASWGLSFERGLVDILVEHNVPIYRGQNGWVADGWRSITAKFNNKFPCAHYTKQQIQQKEKDMKANYKAFQQARKQSGTGWDDNLSMIIAKPVIWEKLKKDYPRVKKYEGKPFLLFPKLASLYEGSIATGDLNFLSIPQVDLTSDVVSPIETSGDQNGNPFSTTHDGGQFSSDMHGQRSQDVEHTTSASSEPKGEPVKKRKQSQFALVLEDYVDFRKKQTQQFVEEMKEPKQGDQFSIANCVAALEPMKDLTVGEKSKALRLFKCQPNREIFLNTKDPILRIFWLKEEIAAMERT